MVKFSFGGWVADPGAMTLSNVRRTVKVEPKAMAVLECLAHSAPEVVPKQTIFATVWPGVVVGENVLHRAVRILRRALGDDAKQPRYIELVPRSGYRLLTTPQFDRHERDDDRARPPPNTKLGELTVLVVPLRGHRHASPTVRSLCADISRHLAWTSSAFRVIRPTNRARTSVDYLAEVDLGTPNEGATTVRWDLWNGPAQELVSASQHAEPHFLSKRRRIGDLIAEGIASDIRHHRLHLLDSCSDIERLSYWDLIMLSEHYRSMDCEQIRTRQRMLKHAIATHPLLAPAHAAYADFLSWEIANGLCDDNTEAEQRVFAEVAVALDLDAHHPYILTRCGAAYSRIGEHERGVDLCWRAVELAPSVFCKDLLARTLTYAGRPQEALTIFEDILRQMPNGHAFQYGRIVVALVQAGHFDEALTYSNRSITHFPKEYFCWVLRSNLLAQLGDLSGAREAIAQAQALMPGVDIERFIEGTARTYGRDPAQRANLTRGLEMLA